jgi:hypothetical protein
MALPQPLHIVRKDLTHLWPETLLVLALFVGYVYVAPSRWTGSQYVVAVALGALLVKVLMVISWLVLIARAIQDESLVGDRQFWTSRPYHWASLFAAKVILILACIYLPFFLMQIYLLHSAGLHPTLAIPALLYNLLLLTVVIIIPLAALSAVTSTFPRVLLTFIVSAVLILILFAAVAYISIVKMQTPHLDWLGNGIFIILPAAALVYQYKTRKTLISRLILVATPLIAVLIFFLTPTSAILARSYPELTGDSNPSLTGLSDKFPVQTPPTGPLNIFRNYVTITLPVQTKGIGPDVNFLVHGTRATVTAPGVSYTTGFLNPNPFTRPAQLNAERPVGLVSFMLPADIFEKIRKSPADIHVDFAAEQLKAEKPSTWHATLLPFSVPGNGVCTFPGENDPIQVPTCRYPLKQPDISFVTAQLSPASCSNPPAAPGQASLGGRGTTLDFDPVITVPLNFQTGDPNPQHNYVLCPGTELHFVEAATLPNASLVLDQKQVTLDTFAARITPRTPGRPNQPQPQADPEP